MPDEIIKLLKNYVDELKQRYAVRNIFIFGSYARGEAKVNSDVDILVEFDKPIGLRFVELAEELEKIIGKKVDLVSGKSVKDQIMMLIKNELIEVNA